MDEIWKRLRELETISHRPRSAATRELFVPRVLRPEQTGVVVSRDLADGPDARHRLAWQ